MFSIKRNRETKAKGKANERVYAIGDIHGCLTETMRLLQTIKTDNDYRDPAPTYLVFLGDIIDRGPNSKGVIELLMDFPFEFATPLFIKGNHEEMMVRGLIGEPNLLPDWLKYGGYSCAESYGLNRSQLFGLDVISQQNRLRAAIPKKHVTFLSEFLDYVQFGDFVFVHAGVRPGIPLHKQNPRELRWIREPFLSYTGDFGAMIVHGHTAVEEIEIKQNRIGLDTGAYQTGRLSAICIEYDDITFFRT